MNSKFTHWKNLRVFSSSLHNTFRRLKKFDEKSSVRNWLKISNVWPISIESEFSRFGRSIQWYKDAFFVGNIFSEGFRGKCILLHYTITPNKQLARHKFLKDELSKATEDNHKVAKIGTKFNKRPWTGLSKQPTIFILIVVDKDNCAQIRYFVLICHIVSRLKFSMRNLDKNCNKLKILISRHKK